MISETISPIKISYNNTILEALKSNRGAYIDDHSKNKAVGYATYVGRFIKDEDEHIVLLAEKEYFCLNPIELGDDGLPHLSCWSVGGIVKISENGTFEKAVEAFNNESKTYPWDSGRIVEIIAI